MDHPTAVTLFGPNGAGKSTLAPDLLARELNVLTFVNADVIAQGLAAFDPASVAVQAGRVMHERLKELRLAGADFAFATTLSGLSLRRTILELHQSGYATRLLCLWTPNPEIAIGRVQARVRLGGHDVPEQDVRRRFLRGVRNFEYVYRRIVSSWAAYDALAPLMNDEPVEIASGSGEHVVEVREPHAWAALQNVARTEEGR